MNVVSVKESTKKEQVQEPHDDKVSKKTAPEKPIVITEGIDTENASPMLPKGAIESPNSKQVVVNKVHQKDETNPVTTEPEEAGPADQAAPSMISKQGIHVKSFPQGTNIFFTNPQSAGFNQAMIDILFSAEEIQNFIEEKMEKSSDGSQKSQDKLGAESRHNTDQRHESTYEAH